MPYGKRPRKNSAWRVIGATVGQFRRASGMSQQRLADEVNLSLDQIASIEQGRRPLGLRLARQLDQLLRTSQTLEVAVAEVPQAERYPLFAQDYMEEEPLALSLMSYENQVVPGLLQTEGYARAVFGNLYPPLSPDELEEKVADRVTRQSIFDRLPWPPMMTFVLEESILRRPIGGRRELHRQIAHLRELAQLPFLNIQIMPTDREHHAGLAGPMVLLETPAHEHLAYLEGQHVSVLVDDPDDVALLQQKYGMLRSQALTPEESMSLMDDLLGDR
ncbi:Scr1 family TA system antitoxin-like transcriptional regulator [Streptomyces sp. NPDC088197]|uniref:helix-turn-helix domain-containing protein n=1 Tax=unclassified Streptomyces TaxID=2593676 RepID=UPI001661D49B|nr:helix-turn-helix transcriptional regulator [Streptomyces sp. CBMA29]MBD0739494.1 transcriptional regulator [Streptomyces sp. CBMA29]